MRRNSFAVAVTFSCAIAIAAAASGQETVRFADDFSGTLDAWPVKNYDWSIQSGQLVGDFRAYCDNNRPWCQEGDLFLADEHQPRTEDWRLEVDFKPAPNSSPDGATNGQGATVMFSFTTTYRNKEVYSIGYGSWTSGPAATAEASVRSFGPWATVATSSIPLNWDPSVFNKATLEKHGSTISSYLNGHLIGTVSRAAHGKVGLHVKGSCVFDNFKITEIGTPPGYAISGNVLKSDGSPMKGVTVTVSPSGKTASTDDNGAYTISALDDRTTYTVTPSYSDGSGTWTFAQPLFLKTVLGASIADVNFKARAPGTERETVRFTDDFSGTLAAWTSTSDGWWILDGHLNGQYSVYCGDTTCPHTYLLLADQYQPRTADWRMEADFMLAPAPWIYHESVVNFALWENATAAEMYWIGWGEDNWDGASRSTIRIMNQTYAPTWLVGYYYDRSTLWNPQAWNRAKLEKRGDVFFFYLNDHLLDVQTGSILTKPKLGFHIYGTTLIDNFKLTELDEGPATVADLSVTQTVSPSPVQPGATMEYTLTVSNLGPSTAPTVTLTDTLPGGASFVSAAGAGWNCSEAGATVTCTRSSLASGGVAPVVITCRAPSAEPETYVVNTAVVASAAQDPAPTNNTSSMTVELAAQAEVIPLFDPRSLVLIAVFLAITGVAVLGRRG